MSESKTALQAGFTWTRGTWVGELRAPPVDIAAQPERVWDVLVDFDAYPDWNPFNRGLTCAGELGDSVVLDVAWAPYGDTLKPTELTITERLTVWESGRCLAYGERYGPFHETERRHLLTATPTGTRYETWEAWHGWLTPLVSRMYGRRILAGFIAGGHALRDRVEGLAAPL
ncbi:MAG: SRPBCC domain-containing protein [Myxococcales bacterium]|nr:SRPBCC domain-containing protein [Myxococcales bacterium]